jgi:hypothetical protein
MLKYTPYFAFKKVCSMIFNLNKSEKEIFEKAMKDTLKINKFNI